jgi:hypothetical protein
MAVSDGTITGVSLLRSKEGSGRKLYLLTVDFPETYTGASDTASIAAVGATILAHTRNGKTVTLRGALPIAPGKDTNAQDVYFTGASVQAATVSSDALTGQLSVAAGTEVTTATASKGVEIAVIVDEA